MNAVIRNHFGYHRWATQRLLASVDQLSETQYRANSGLCFRSIHGTLSHLLLADKLWLDRLAGHSAADSHSQLVRFWDRAQLYSAPDARSIYWEEYIKDRRKLAAELILGCDKLAAFADALPEAVPDEFSYHRKGQGLVTKQLVPVLLHIVNHGTHHRGQISAVITAAGFPPPVLDLLYFEG